MEIRFGDVLEPAEAGTSLPSRIMVLIPPTEGDGFFRAIVLRDSVEGWATGKKWSGWTNNWRKVDDQGTDSRPTV